MDPLSIAAHAGQLRVCCDEIINLSARILASKIPDSDSVLSGLNRELPYVASSLEEIQQVWKTHGPTLMMHPAAGFGMWPNVQKNLESANVSFQAVKSKLIPVLESVGKRGGFLGINSGAFKFGLRVRALAVYQERIRAHHTAFRIGTNMMTMYVRLVSRPNGVIMLRSL
ncbi:hypothetical protein MYCTH_2301764 [Thermothelomyces thermophilus ATCC 42464]|uniref:Uncharacterized protein n=1 Tax=Thermothelomyces thermophilus (strain ATCC 42464 / BCRC 31852 / DSM 1799) TaxID=573729 RepID=G2QA26_THET4|nr:uncharacterized protein MYCTH_2301764 [Thermothelomyces thermophilus ATCC 42464]AEO56630.1 hypothetical protein MYCTH_2301764 [Thermothelomyces thermophilus ATCC 42464]